MFVFVLLNSQHFFFSFWYFEISTVLKDVLHFTEWSTHPIVGYLGKLTHDVLLNLLSLYGNFSCGVFQTWSDVSKLDETCLDWIKLVQTWWSFIKLDEICWKLIKHVLIGLKVSKFDKIFPNLIKLVHMKFVQVWLNLSKLD